MAGSNAEASDLEEGSEVTFVAKDDGRKRFKTNVLDLCNNADEEHKCMVIFKVGTTDESEEDIKVHSCLLAAKSPAFDKMFFGPLKEIGAIKLRDTEPETFRIFVRFLYTHSKDLITEDQVEGLMYLASKYCIQDLFSLCEEFLAAGIKVTNIASLLNTGVLFECKYLQAKVFEFIIKNQAQLFPSSYFNDCNIDSFKFLLKSPYLAVREDKILDILQIWVNAELSRNDLSLKDSNGIKIMEPLLKLIRLNSLTFSKIDLLLDSDLCPHEAKEDILANMQAPTFYFVPKFFSTSPRWNPCQALGYKTRFFAKEVDNFEISFTQRLKFTMCGFFVKVAVSSKYMIKVQDLETEAEMSMFTPRLKHGYYLGFIPRSGFPLRRKGQAQITPTTPEQAENRLECVCIRMGGKLLEDVNFRAFESKSLPCRIISKPASSSNALIFGFCYEM